MKCDICGKDRKCQDWAYIIKKRGIGRKRQFTPGTDLVHTVGGKEVGREKDTTYTTGKVTRVAEKGTAHICIPCRVIWSAVIVLGLSVLLSLVLALLFSPKDVSFIGYVSEYLMYLLPAFALLALTPLMKHLILSVKIAFQRKVLPWKVMSKFWE